MNNLFYTIIIYPLYQIIEIVFRAIFEIFKIPGFSIIGVSAAVSIMCLPLYAIAEKWQTIERNTQKKLKPGIDRIKATFKGDEQYMILNTFYHQNHYHPLMSLRSSIGLLIQIPFFIAAYSFLSSCPEIQRCSFLWIENLANPDALLKIGAFQINVLPLLMTAINIFAGIIYTKGFSLREKLQIHIMAIVFLIILYQSPSGLVLYWTMNNVFSLIKNIFYKLKNLYKDDPTTEYTKAKEEKERIWNNIYLNYPYLMLEENYSYNLATSSSELYKMAQLIFKGKKEPEKGYSLSVIDYYSLMGYHGEELKPGYGIQLNANEYYDENDDIYRALSQYLFITDVSYTLRKDDDLNITVNNIKYQEKLLQSLVKLIR